MNWRKKKHQQRFHFHWTESLTTHMPLLHVFKDRQVTFSIHTKQYIILRVMFVSIALFASMICFGEWFWEWTIGVLGDIIVQDKPSRAVVLLLQTNSYWQIRHPQPSSVKQRFEFIVLPLLLQTRLQSDSLQFALKYTSLLRKISLKQHKVLCWSACLLFKYSQLARL